MEVSFAGALHGGAAGAHACHVDDSHGAVGTNGGRPYSVQHLWYGIRFRAFGPWVYACCRLLMGLRFTVCEGAGLRVRVVRGSEFRRI